MATLTITITGNTTADLEDALSEVTRLVSYQYVSGFDSSETSSYTFEVEGNVTPD